MRLVRSVLLVLLCLVAFLASADSIEVHRASGPIEVDGDLADAAWQDAARIDTFYETQPGDNIAPPVRTTGWITYDDRFVYVALELQDPNIAQLRAPFADRDQISESTDYAGVVLDTRNDGKTAVVLLSN